MRLTLESTDQIVTVDGTFCRVWNGKSERGVDCVALIKCLRVHGDDPAEEFERELHAIAPPNIQKTTLDPRHAI